jgi:hypothetical protein
MKWTKEHTAQVLELYLKERPRAQDKQEQQVREMAAKLERSPASIGMKIANFIFLDPLAEERNRKGMSQVSELDKEVWLELSGVPLSTRAAVGDSATHQIMSETIGFDIELIENKRVAYSLLSKPFLILTGNSGTGKTLIASRLAEKFSSGGKYGDPFFAGAEIASDRISYFVAKSDSQSVEFWNSKNSETAMKATLPREVIKEWADCILAKGWDDSVTARQIREVVTQDSSFSSQLHSFETHLKAAAFALLKSVSKDIEGGGSALVAVGADWTDNRNVVGYVNHLREAKMAGAVDSRPVYQSTPVLDLLLEASKPGRESLPHFLILDEMNLSHVERYFADFLSAMEARSGAIRFHEEGAGNTKAETGDLKPESGTPEADFRLPRFEGDTVGVPRSLPYPQNLFVIGTVNVDETTYMFSPKVLDRAHVIEFEVDPDDVKAFLNDPKPLQPVPRAAAGQAEAFLALSLRARGLQEPPLPELPPAVKTEVNKHLLEVLEILQNGRFEFAFRTAKEVVAYLKVSHELATDKTAWEAGKWKSDLDDEILQKILPRLHGSRTRVGPLLGALGWYLHTGEKEEAMKFFPAPGEELPEKPVQEIIALHKLAAAFPRSFAKVQRMARVVIEEQFVSFIC